MIRKFLAIIFFLGLGFVTLFAQSRSSQTSIDSIIRNQLKAEILQMGKADQQYRFKLMFGEADGTKIDSLLQLPDSVKFSILGRTGTKDYTLNRTQYDSIVALQRVNDSNNIKRLLEIFRQYGWPGYSLVGGEATGVTSAILLHMPNDLQLELYPQLIKEIKKGNIYPSAVATTYDKYLMGTNKPQLYGMFGSRDKDGKQVPPKIKSIKATNKARKKLGLPPLEKYQIVQ